MNTHEFKSAMEQRHRIRMVGNPRMHDWTEAAFIVSVSVRHDQFTYYDIKVQGVKSRSEGRFILVESDLQYLVDVEHSYYGPSPLFDRDLYCRSMSTDMMREMMGYPPFARDHLGVPYLPEEKDPRKKAQQMLHNEMAKVFSEIDSLDIHIKTFNSGSTRSHVRDVIAQEINDSISRRKKK